MDTRQMLDNDIVKQCTQEKHIRKTQPVNCVNNMQLIDLGLRNPFIKVDRACFVNTKEEKVLLKKLKKSIAYEPKGYKLKQKEVFGKLVINLVNTGNTTGNKIISKDGKLVGRPNPFMSNTFKTVHTFHKFDKSCIYDKLDSLERYYNRNNTRLVIKSIMFDGKLVPIPARKLSEERSNNA